MVIEYVSKTKVEFALIICLLKSKMAAGSHFEIKVKHAPGHYFCEIISVTHDNAFFKVTELNSGARF